MTLAATDPDRIDSLPTVARDLLSLSDLDGPTIQELLDLATIIKSDPRAFTNALSGRSVALIFEKPSLRTRASLEVGLHRLGAQSVVFDQRDSPLGARESIHDLGRNLERWFDLVAARVHRHGVLETLADACDVPILNTLSDLHHPCQALADLLSLHERGIDPARSRVAFIGDGNNVCRSFVHGIVSLGGTIIVVSPPEHGPCDDLRAWAETTGVATGGVLETTNDPRAVSNCAAVYTDTWISMGESDSTRKRDALRPYRVDSELMTIAAPGAVFMHCLPAHRGEEVVDEVIDGPDSIVFDQAENRLHAQNAWILSALSSS